MLSGQFDTFFQLIPIVNSAAIDIMQVPQVVFVVPYSFKQRNERLFTVQAIVAAGEEMAKQNFRNRLLWRGDFFAKY